MKKHILVTGSHRSGSTWIGKVIGEAKNVRYVHEPFNIELNRKNSPFDYWFEHMNNAPLEHQKRVKEYLNSFFILFHIQNLKRILSFDSKKAIIWFYDDFKRRLKGNQIIIKDPIAILSAEWLYKVYGWNIVVVIRHPAAFVASIKLKNWGFDFNHFLEQTVLINGYLKEYSEIIEEYSKKEKDIVDQGILLWNIFHDVIAKYQEKYKNDWYFVKHEDLSINPIPEFEQLFSFLNLNIDKNVKNYIEKTTTSKDSSRLNRDSVKNIKTWKNRLKADEVRRIKEGTQNIWPQFYSEKDW